MKMLIKHQLLDDVINKTSLNSETLFQEIDAMNQEINVLKTIWQGEEAGIFYIKIENYLEKLKSIPETYNTFSKFMKKANIAYRQADESFALDMQKVRNTGNEPKNI